MGTAGVALGKKAQKIALDSGAIIALSRRDENVFALLRKLRREGAMIFVPAPVFAEVLRGSARDARVHQILNSLDEEVDTSAAAAREAGRLIGAALPRAASVVDALIVATALEGGATTIVTSDANDMARLAPSSLAVVSI